MTGTYLVGVGIELSSFVTLSVLNGQPKAHIDIGIEPGNFNLLPSTREKDVKLWMEVWNSLLLVSKKKPKPKTKTRSPYSVGGGVTSLIGLLHHPVVGPEADRHPIHLPHPDRFHRWGYRDQMDSHWARRSKKIKGVYFFLAIIVIKKHVSVNVFKQNSKILWVIRSQYNRMFFIYSRCLWLVPQRRCVLFTGLYMINQSKCQQKKG